MKVQGQDFEEEVSAIESREDHNESVQAGKAPTPKIAGQVKHIPLNINTNKLMNMLNATLKELGKNVGVCLLFFS